MLVKGIIEEKVDIYSYRVRIPFLNKVEGDSNPTLTEDLSVAAISTIPGIHSVFEQGDVVFIDFENDDFSDPVILGLLDRTSDKTSYNNIDTTSLNVDLTANLPYETYIGDITPFELSSLSGIKGNLQEQLSIQENTIETYMCIYGEDEFNEINYQYGQKRALFVKVDNLDGYTGTIALTRIDSTYKVARFEGIVSDLDTGLHKKVIELVCSVVNDVSSWSYALTDIVPPGLVWDKASNIDSWVNLKTQLTTWVTSMETESSRIFYFTVSGNWSPWASGSGVTAYINRSINWGTAIFTSRYSAISTPGSSLYTSTWSNAASDWSGLSKVIDDNGGTINGKVIVTAPSIVSSSQQGSITIAHGTANNDAMLITKRTDTNTVVGFGVGTGGTNHGVYSHTLGKWMIYGDASSVRVNGTAENVTGTVAIANGGTGATGVAAANNNLRSWSLSTGTAIPQGSDLNTYKTEGNYTCAATATAKTLLHNPYADTASNSMVAFIMKVVYSTSGSTYVRQELFEYNTSKHWIRWSNNSGSTWTAWRNVSYDPVLVSLDNLTTRPNLGLGSVEWIYG